MLKLPRPPPPSRVPQLKRPQKVARLLEIGPHGENLVDQVLHTDDPKFPQMLLENGIIRQWNPLPGPQLVSNLAISALVDQGAYGFQVRVSVGDEGFDDLEHFYGGFCEADENRGVDLEEAEELKGFARFGGDFVDTMKKWVSEMEFG